MTLRLELSPDQKLRLLTEMRRFNEAAQWLSGIAFTEKIFSWLPLQRRAYRELRERFRLKGAQAVVCVRKVAYAYSNPARRVRQANFRPLGSMPLYTHRYKRDGTVAFYGMRLPFLSPKDVALSSKCQAKLVCEGSKILIHQALEIEEATPIPTLGYLGVDLGLARIAVDSDGTTHPGTPHPFTPGQLRGQRRRHARLRQKLQKKSTRSARRLLRKRRRRERRFASHVNHAVAKDLVAKAKGTERGIALEDLRGIRSRITARKAQRRDIYSWAFAQLREFIEYKARKEGVRVEFVDPRNTSLTCPGCGKVGQKNRPERDRFCCVGCGLAGPADAVAAENIRRAAGSRPDAAA
ncbi:MAG TPA: transposase [Planctomycetota bacterium]|nr:transposase [Planctomycetota bacterium]